MNKHFIETLDERQKIVDNVYRIIETHKINIDTIKNSEFPCEKLKNMTLHCETLNYHLLLQDEFEKYLKI